MARAAQQPWNYIPLLTEAEFARSREPHLAAGGVLPGDLLTEVGNLATTAPDLPPLGPGPDANSPRWIALSRSETATPSTILVLARDAEINDGYINYRTLGRYNVDRILGLYSIIVRPGVFQVSANFSAAGIDPTSGEPLPEGEESRAIVPIEAARGGEVEAVANAPLVVLAARGWAIMLHFRSYFIAFAMRWGRR